MTLFFAFCLSLPIAGHTEDDWPGQFDNPFDSPNDDWSKRFNERIDADDNIRVEKPRQNNQLDNDWRNPRQKRQSLSEIHSRQFQQRGYD